MIYILDTNVISDLMKNHSAVQANHDGALRVGDVLAICQPVYHEALRGLLWSGSTNRRQILDEIIIPEIDYIELVDDDWRQAAAFWADLRRAGKQLSDMDLLIAAVTLRVGGVLVTADDDFDALPIQRQNWRRT